MHTADNMAKKQRGDLTRHTVPPPRPESSRHVPPVSVSSPIEASLPRGFLKLWLLFSLSVGEGPLPTRPALSGPSMAERMPRYFCDEFEVGRRDDHRQGINNWDRSTSFSCLELWFRRKRHENTRPKQNTAWKTQMTLIPRFFQSMFPIFTWRDRFSLPSLFKARLTLSRKRGRGRRCKDARNTGFC